MSDNFPCQRHDEQIKTLFKRVDAIEKRDDIIHNLDKNMALQTQLMKSVVEHNVKQDKRADDHQEIISKININLTELNEGQRTTNEELKSLGTRMDTVETKVDANEEKHNIDTRDIEKKRYIEVLSKYVLSIGLFSLLILEVLKIVKG